MRKMRSGCLARHGRRSRNRTRACRDQCGDDCASPRHATCGTDGPTVGAPASTPAGTPASARGRAAAAGPPLAAICRVGETRHYRGGSSSGARGGETATPPRPYARERGLVPRPPGPTFPRGHPPRVRRAFPQRPSEHLAGVDRRAKNERVSVKQGLAVAPGRAPRPT